MAYAERRGGKLTGWWKGEVEVTVDGVKTRFKKRFKSQGEAAGWEAYIHATGGPPTGSQGAPTVSFATVVERFKADNPDWGIKDHSSLQRLDTLCERLGAIDIKAIDTTHLDALVDWLRTRPGMKKGGKLTSSTINRYLAAASAVLRWAHRRRLTPGMVYVPFRKAKSERLLTVSFDLEDAICRHIGGTQQFDGAAGTIAFLIRVLAATGLRKGELWKLRPEQIGDEAITLKGEQTKTDRARVVPVEPDMAKRLRALVALKALPNSFRVYRCFKEAVVSVGGPEELTLHSLRHTCASRLIDAGVDSLVVADMLGHSSTSTTHKYTHPALKTMSEAMKKVRQAREDSAQKGAVVAFQPHEKSA